MEDNKNLYKYMGPEIADKFLQSNGNCSLKFSYLKDYNDPFEFFLTIDYNQEPEILAYYNEMISMVTQQPVTCFSKSPLVTPMWAHYASNSQGFLAEINEAALDEWLKSKDSDPSFGDIDYRETPCEGMQGMLERAYVISKPRHIGWLQQAIGSTAYYTKQTCWSYEQERRLIIDEKCIEKINENLMLLYFPANLITSFVVGAKASQKLKSKIKEISESIRCNYYEKHIGKSSTTPFFLDENLQTHIFDGREIAPKSERCSSCKEPMTSMDSKFCSWCRIDESHKKNAAYRNPFRMLERAGILEQYIANFREIGKK
ncbi:DUF2971 domain-containing protein [Pseudomonas syringae]|uniref:DUF2971 domain-containing protein n=1 Tax=Pseudomonas syringae TaxID=317 RepID=A0A6B2B1J7_PSESX|nr:DUF2971 domain-containing protein [Pseudomonas syringae]MDC6491668.1 DUF2971 domain-containing protein [Pseudomonas syringae]MDC6501577.1 DUF2971 domain-containing protein [Pseudomonas syringae]MDC6512136.1 DUF2971 domain-containing protein [Pseudomonas syringae]MDC6533058.1 DUF2971 domain-containing protein [Pseudomonas syringae]MDC6554675.1 DUF2971 domain-containing protein [Pseudomonas syringae]